MKRRNPDAQAFLNALVGVILMVLAFIVIITLVSLARAQGADFSWSPIEWGSNPIAAAAALAGLVVMLRATSVGSWIDGPVRVGVVSIVIGGVGGTGLQLLGLLTVDPYTAMAAPLGGIAYGASLGVFNATGIAVWNYLTGKVRPITVNVSDGLAPLAFAAAQERSGGSVADFIVGLVKNAVSAAQLPAALVAVAPLLAKFAQSELVLTDELRSSLQGQVLKLLRKAGLAGVDL